MAEALAPVFSRIDALKRQLYDMITNPRDYASMLGGRVMESAAQREAVQQQAFANPQNPLQITNPQALNQLTNMILAGEMGFAPAGITAYHGSPYLFRQFDPMKVGTGEGAQAYGVGSGYTAEARPVAESYKLAGNEGFKIQAAKFAEEKYGSIENAITALQNQIKDPNWGQNVKENAKEVLDGLNQLKAGKAGYLYKGDIPDEILPKFLDWDKPLSQQSDDVRNVLKRRITDVQPTDKFDMGGNARLRDNRQGQYDKTSTSPWILESYDAGGTRAFGLSQKDVDRMFGAKDAKDLTGEQIYARLTQEMGSQQAASSYLESIGLRGIRYLDQGSRGEGRGTSNFIPFRPEDYKIESINDIPIQQYIEQGLL